MPSLKEKALDEIDYYIDNHNFRRARYEIDLDLLSWGFEPDWIDESWQNQAKRRRRIDRYARIEKKIFLINIFLLIWFFKPNLPLFYDIQNNDIPNQTILIPFVLLFLIAIVLWYKYRPYTKFIESRHYWLTIAPIVPLLMLFTISFAVNLHYPSSEVDNPMPTRDANQYKLILRDTEGNYTFYKCDNFGLLCFEVKHWHYGQ